MRSNTERAKLWVDGALLVNFAAFPFNTLTAAATVAVVATDNAGLHFTGVNSLFEVMLEHEKPASSAAAAGVTMTYNTLLTGYHDSEDTAFQTFMHVMPSAASPSASSLTGPGLTRAAAGAVSTFDIQVRDAYGSAVGLPAASNSLAKGSDLIVVSECVRGDWEVCVGSVWSDGRVLQPAVYTDATYGSRTGPGRYIALFKPTRSGAYVISVQRLSQAGLQMQLFCSALETIASCQQTQGTQPIISRAIFETIEAQQAASAGFGIRAVCSGYLVFRTTETLTFTAVGNGSISLRVDDKVCTTSRRVQRVYGCYQLLQTAFPTNPLIPANSLTFA